MNGLLRNKRATCFPGFENKLLGAQIEDKGVVSDEGIITSRGLGTAIEFALAIITELRDHVLARQIAASIQYQ